MIDDTIQSNEKEGGENEPNSENNAQNSVEVPLLDANGKFNKGHAKVGGIPKGKKHLSTLLRKALEQQSDVEIVQPDGTTKKITLAEAVIWRLTKIAVTSQEDKDAIKGIAEIFDRDEGKARGSLNLGVDNDITEIVTTILHKDATEYNRDRNTTEERGEQDEDNA